MKKYNDNAIIDLMCELEDRMEEQYNASFALTGYGEYLETFKSWSKEVQEKIMQFVENGLTKEIFNLVETQEINYFDISFD